MLPRETDPKLIEAGAIEIAAAAAVVCWLGALLDALVNPMHPELYSVAKSRRTSEIEDLRAGVESAALFLAPRNSSAIVMVFILLIVVCRLERDYCPNGQIWDRGADRPLPNGYGGKRRAAP